MASELNWIAGCPGGVYRESDNVSVREKDTLSPRLVAGRGRVETLLSLSDLLSRGAVPSSAPGSGGRGAVFLACVSVLGLWLSRLSRSRQLHVLF